MCELKIGGGEVSKLAGSKKLIDKRGAFKSSSSYEEREREREKGRPRSARAKNPSAKSRVAIKWFFPSGSCAEGLRFDRGSIGRQVDSHSIKASGKERGRRARVKSVHDTPSR